MSGEQALVQQARERRHKIVKVNQVGSLGHVVGDRLNPRPADRLVVLLRHTGVPRGLPDPLAHKGDGGRGDVPADGQPRQMKVLPMAEPVARPGDLVEKIREGDLVHRRCL